MADWPDDPVEQAHRVMGDDAPLVRLLARRVAARRALSSSQVGRDLIDEASGILAQKVWKTRPSFGGSRPRFLAWARKVLTSELIDRLRHQARQPKAVDPTTLGAATPLTAFRGGRPDPHPLRDRSYPSPILANIERWPLVCRVVLLAYCKLWSRVPLWEDWVREYGLELPFPPDDLALAATKVERHRALAAALGWERGVLNTFLYRNKHRLDDLPPRGEHAR